MRFWEAETDPRWSPDFEATKALLLNPDPEAGMTPPALLKAKHQAMEGDGATQAQIEAHAKTVRLIQPINATGNPRIYTSKGLRDSGHRRRQSVVLRHFYARFFSQLKDLVRRCTYSSKIDRARSFDFDVQYVGGLTNTLKLHK